MTYLDYAATTPMLEEVFEVMRPFQTEHFGNPSSVYGAGRDAKKGLEEAREKVADAIGAQPSEIVFTAGGTEADNLALKGVAFRLKGNGRHIITAAAEHHAVLHSAQWLESQGFQVTVLNVDKQGLVDLEQLAGSLTKDTVLVSIMLVNNEVGVIQPLEEITRIVKAGSKAVVHTDAVQGLGKIPTDVERLGVDAASFSAHKLGGPKGTGALYVKRGTALEPILHGGGQERDRRSGTPNVAGIAGFGEAARIASAEVEAEGLRLGGLRDRLQEAVTTQIHGVHLNSPAAPRIPGTLNVCIEGVQGESLLLLLDQAGIAASSGSACTSGSLDPSHVLVAMGVQRDLALGSLRLSLGRGSKSEDIDRLIQVLPSVVDKLRAIPSSNGRQRAGAGRNR